MRSLPYYQMLTRSECGHTACIKCTFSSRREFGGNGLCSVCEKTREEDTGITTVYIIALFFLVIGGLLWVVNDESIWTTWFTTTTRECVLDAYWLFYNFSKTLFG